MSRYYLTNCKCDSMSTKGWGLHPQTPVESWLGVTASRSIPTTIVRRNARERTARKDGTYPHEAEDNQPAPFGERYADQGGFLRA